MTVTADQREEDHEHLTLNKCMCGNLALNLVAGYRLSIPVYAAEGNYLWKMELNLSVILWRSENKATRRRCAEPLRNT